MRLTDDNSVDHIKASFRRCVNVPEVNETARHFWPDVKELSASDNRGDRTMAIQIKNLAHYRRLCIGKGWG